MSKITFLLIFIIALIGNFSSTLCQTTDKNQASLTSPTSSTSSTIVFMTDFGDNDDSVAICKGVMLGIAPNSTIIDISHNVTPFSILDGARFLAGTAPYYNSGTVFIVVIDPGVGSSRKAIVAKSKRGQYFVLPNNGLLTLIQQQDGLESVREITNTNLMIGQTLSSTFHGRDIFSPVAGHLAHGEDWTTVGPIVAMSEIVKLNISPAELDEKGLKGNVIALDGKYGNLVTNIDAQDFYKLGYKVGEKIPLTIGQENFTITFAKTFSDVAPNTPLLYIDSRGHLAVAINLGNFAETYKIQPPLPIVFSKKLSK